MGDRLRQQGDRRGLLIPPFASQIEEQGLGFVFADPDDFVTPHPMTIAVNFINTDWAAKNPELVKKFFVAYLRGVRDYCQAYHGGPNRNEVIDLWSAPGSSGGREMLRQISLDGAQSRRPHQCRQHARHPGLLREGETLAEGISRPSGW